MLGKRRVPTRLKELQQGLLDPSVDDARHAELSDPALRLGGFDPFDRLGLVGSFEPLGPDARPVLTPVVLGVVDGHAIDAGTALVPANLFPRCFEVLSLAQPPPSVVPPKPGFRTLASPRVVRPLGNR